MFTVVVFIVVSIIAMLNPGTPSGVVWIATAVAFMVDVRSRTQRLEAEERRMQEEDNLRR